MTREIQTTVQGFPVRTGPGGTYVPKTVQGMQSLVAWASAGTDRPDAWLVEEISRGFRQFLLLRLDGVPSAELISMTADMWVSVVSYGLEEDLDRERIRKGFGQLLRKIKRWPQPVELLDALPTRMSRPRDSKTPEAPVSDEVHARGKAAFEDIMEKLR